MTAAEPCGGCQGLGRHKRWCHAVVGRAASVYGPMSERVEAMGDTVGSNNPGLANRYYDLAARTRAWATELAEKSER